MPDSTKGQDALRRAISERASEFAVGHRVGGRHRYWQQAIALAGALLVVALVFIGFDSFLTGMQKVIAIMAADPAPTPALTPTPTEAMPVFMVPEPPDPP